MMEKSLLDSIEIKTPCTESWDEMIGNNEVRFCSHCAKDVHNLSTLTRQQARKLIARSKGNLCVLYVKRPDGKVQTMDRKFYQINRRTPQIAAGILSMALSLSATAYAQKSESVTLKQEDIALKGDDNKIIAKTGSITGTIFDSTGAVVPGTKVTLRDTKNETTQAAVSNDDGIYKFSYLTSSVYEIIAEAVGFKKTIVTNLEVTDNQNLVSNLSLEVSSALMGVVVIVEDYKVEMLQAASIGDKVKLQELISAKKDVNEKDNDGKSALHVAAEAGDLEILQMLIDAKANVNITSNNGITPLMIAAQNDEPEVVKILLKAGAKPNIKDKSGETAIQKTDSEEIKQLFKQYSAK